ncbi:MAG: HNH endonuclease signature motif containing protein [Pseudomonadota bacterium]
MELPYENLPDSINPLLEKNNRNACNDTKVCIKCGKVFRRNPEVDAKQWSKQRNCSKKCAATKFYKYDRQAALLDFVKGMPFTEIAKKYSLSPGSIRQLTNKIGLKRRPDLADEILKNRILDGVNINPLTGCWEWKGTINSNGYGMITCFGRQRVAHRVSYAVFNGRFDLAKDVCHKCDNRNCVNPEHLFIASRKENMKDASDKGRTANAERLPQTKLSWKDVRKVRELRATGVGLKQLAVDYGVTISCISAVTTGRNWKSPE